LRSNLATTAHRNNALQLLVVHPTNIKNVPISMQFESGIFTHSFSAGFHGFLQFSLAKLTFFYPLISVSGNPPALTRPYTDYFAFVTRIVLTYVVLAYSYATRKCARTS
jgi:F0F1-type ATP synthase assembly protein I